METITLTTPSALPKVALRANAPLTLDEATAWAEKLGAPVVYYLYQTRMAFVVSNPLTFGQEQEPK
jgi:hypothetical protein